MASTIKLKNGSGAPTAGDLVQGEPALDLTNKRLYTEDSGGTVIEVGVNPTSLTTGTFTSTGIDDNATSTAITIDNSGNVGIGSTNPPADALLTLAGVQGSTQSLMFNGFGTDKDAAISHQNGVISFLNGGNNTTVSNLSERMRIDSSGNVGIGTSSPSLPLDIQGGNGLGFRYLETSTGNSNRIQFGTGSGFGYIDATAGIGSTALSFQVASTERMRIDSSGNVGIGTSSPSSKLHLSGDGDSASKLTVQRTGATVGTAVLGYDYVGSFSNNDFKLFANSTERMRIDSSGNVGIGTSSPSEELHLSKSASGADVCARIQNSAVSSGDTATLRFSVTSNSSFDSAFVGSDRNNALILGSNAAERMRINAAGVLSVANTTTAYGLRTTSSLTGMSYTPTDYLTVASDGVYGLAVNRLNSDGDLIHFGKDGTTVGSIGTDSSLLQVSSASTGGLFLADNGTNLVGFVNGESALRPAGDNYVDLGKSDRRFDDIYATNALIQTSDRNEKQDIAELSDAEQRVAKACKGLLRKFRWKDAVAEKGDDARIHFGIIAQDLQSAFEAEGLDAGDYAMFISSTWYEKEITVDAVEAVYEDVVVTPAQEAGFREVSPEVQAEPAYYDVDGNEIKAAVEYQAAVHEATEAVEEVTEQRLVSEAKEAYTYTDTSEEPKEGYTERTRMGVRYPELLSFIIAAI